MSQTKECKNLLLNLLKFDTQNFDDQPSRSTLDLLKFIKNRLDKSGAECKLQEYTTIIAAGNRRAKLRRFNLIAKKQKRNRPYLLLQGHVDTVPYNENEWKYSPLGQERNNLIYGRGAVDMKGPVTSMILAFEKIVKMGNLEYSPMLLLTSDEEAQSFAGIKNFIKNNKEKIAFAVSCEPTNLHILNNLFGAIYCIIKTFSTSSLEQEAYSSKNAIENMLPVLHNIGIFKKKILKLRHPFFGQSIVNVGKINGGLKVNQIPHECDLEIAIRNTASCAKCLKLFKKEVLEKIRTPYKFKVVFQYDPIILKPGNEIVGKFKNIFKKMNMKIRYGAEQHFTEATILNQAGIPAIVFGPGDKSLAHCIHENIKVDDLLKAKEIYINIYR